MQDGGEPDFGAEMVRISGSGQQRSGGAAKQQPVKQAFVLQGQWAELVRQGEHNVELGHIQQIRLLGAHPVGLFLSLALRAVAITAGVVSYLLVAALGAPAKMPAKGCRSAGGQIIDDSTLKKAGLILLQILPAIAAQYIGHLYRSRIHRVVGVGRPVMAAPRQADHRIGCDWPARPLRCEGRWT